MCPLLSRLWHPEPHPESLFQTGVCPPGTDIAVERDLTTGELLGYHEVGIATTTFVLSKTMQPVIDDEQLED